MSTLHRRRLLGTMAAVPAAAGVAIATGGAATAAASTRTHATSARAARAALAVHLASDMTGYHAGLMHGVPLTYSWARSPWLVLGSHPGAFTAMNPWGQIYEWADGSPALNVRVACRDMSGWILSRRTRRWHQVAASEGVFGANYVESFVGNVNKPAPLRDEPDGSVSSTLGGGFNFHFFPTRPRVVFDPNEVAGVITLCSARVIVDDPNGPDERSQARYLASCGADYWLDSTTDGSDGQTGPVGVGKARWLTSQWKTITMSTVPFHLLRRTCPALMLHGRGR